MGGTRARAIPIGSIYSITANPFEKWLMQVLRVRRNDFTERAAGQTRRELPATFEDRSLSCPQRCENPVNDSQAIYQN